MNMASRTPDGLPNRCPVCGGEIRVWPSQSAGDAPCPRCGTLLWFTQDGSGATFFHPRVTSESLEAEVVRETPADADPESVRRAANFRRGDHVRITTGTFEDHHGDISSIDLGMGRVTLEINLFGRDVPVELESWQVEIVGR